MVTDSPSLGDHPYQISSTYLYYFARYALAATSKTFCPAPLPEILVPHLVTQNDPPQHLVTHVTQIESPQGHFHAKMHRPEVIYRVSLNWARGAWVLATP